MGIGPPIPPEPGWIGDADGTWYAVAVAALAGVPALPAAPARPAPPSTATTATPAMTNRCQDLGRLLAGLSENGLPEPPRGSSLGRNSDDIGDQLLAGAMHSAT